MEKKKKTAHATGFVVDKTGCGEVLLGVSLVFPYHKFHSTILHTSPVAVYDGCGIVEFVYWLRLKQYL